MQNAFQQNISDKSWIDSRKLIPKGACAIITSASVTLVAFGSVSAPLTMGQNMPNIINVEYNDKSNDAILSHDTTIEEDLAAHREAMAESGDSKDFESLCHELGL